MAKPLTEHRATLKSRKVDTFQPVDEHMEPVTGGSVRRVVFEGHEPEPVEFVPRSERKYVPRHEASIDAIEREVDLIGRNGAIDYRRAKATGREHVYETRGGNEVRAAEVQFGERTRTVLYTTEDKGTHLEERRFNNADVDKVIANVTLEPEVEVIKKTETKVIKRKKKVVEKVPVTTKPAKKAAKPAKKTAKSAKAKLPTDYKGDVHAVVDLEGIGPTYEAKLHKAKITNTQELLFTDDKKLAKITGAPAKTIQNWKDMSQLVKLNGVGPQFAELMVRAGIDGIDGIKKLDPKQGAAQIKAYQAGLKSNVTGSGIGVKRLSKWQEEAKSLRRVPIDLAKIEVVALESNAAQASGIASAVVSCAAYTKAGDACKNTPRGTGKYCASHKGYRAPTKAQLAANAKS